MMDCEIMQLLSEALCCFRRYDFAGYQTKMEQARAAISGRGDPNALLGEWLLLDALLAFGRADALVPMLRQAWQTLGRGSRVVPRGTALMLDSYDPFSSFWHSPGTADTVAALVEEAEKLWTRLTGGGQGSAVLYRARLAYFRGELPQALALAKHARQLAERWDQKLNRLAAAEILGMLARHCDDGSHLFETAIAVCSDCIADENRVISQTGQIVRSNLYLSIGVLSETPDWVKDGDFGAASSPRVPGWYMLEDKLVPTLLPSAQLIRMQYLGYAEKYIEALVLADTTQRVFGIRIRLVDIYLDFWRGYCYEALGDSLRSRAYAAAMLRASQADGLWLIPGEYGVGLSQKAELEQAYGRERVQWLNEVHSRMHERNKCLREQYLRKSMRDPLTKREREVLALVNNGDTNAQIAAALGIGVETVKSHLKHAFDKLGISNRTQASKVIGQAKTAVWVDNEKTFRSPPNGGGSKNKDTLYYK